MRILPCQDSSRGPKATLLVYEECRLLKKGMVDSVFEKWHTLDKQNIYLIQFMATIQGGKRNANTFI